MTEELQLKKFAALSPKVRDQLLHIADAQHIGAASKKRKLPCDARAQTAQIIEVVCNICNVTIEMLASQTRERDIVHPRHMAIYLMCSNGISFTQAAQLFNRDHSTAIYACESHFERLVGDRYYTRTYQTICKELNRLNNNPS